MQTATVFSYENDFTERMKDLFEEIAEYLGMDQHFPVINFPLYLEGDDFPDEVVVAQAYFDLLVEIKARMFYGTSLALIN